MWQFYLIISILLISFNGLFHRSLMKDDKSSPQAQTIAFLGLGGIIAIIIALIEGKLNLFFPHTLLLYFLILILLLTPAYLLSYRSYQLLGASEVVLFLATGRLWNVIGAYFFLHEVVTLKMVFGAIIILSGVTITLYDRKKFTINKGVVFALIAAFLYGMGDIDGYYILRTYDATNFLIYSEFLPIIAIMLLQPKIIKKLQYYFQKDKAVKLLLLSLFDALGTLALYLAYQVGRNASVISPLSATRVLVTTILAIVVLKERTNVVNKILGAIVTVIGVILLLKYWP